MCCFIFSYGELLQKIKKISAAKLFKLLLKMIDEAVCKAHVDAVQSR